jgi:cytochrome P450
VPVRLGPSRGLLLYHPDAIEEVLVVRSRDFIESRGVRRLMQPAFHRQRVAAYGEVMAAYAARHAAGWQDGTEIDIHAEMMPAWLPAPANLRANAAIRRLDRVVYRMLGDRRRSPEDRGDLPSILLQAQAPTTAAG